MQPYEILNEWRSTLLSFGLGPMELLAIGVVCGLSLLVATREVLCWFLKVDSIKKEVRQLKSAIEALRYDLKQSEKFAEPTKKTEEPSPPVAFFKKSRAFRIFH